MKLQVFSIVLLVFVLSFSFVFAQGISTTIQGIDITMSNDSPAPGQKVTVTAESYSTDLNSANITWKLNNNIYQKGIGVTSIEITAPELGKKLNVTVTAVTAEGRTMTASAAIQSGQVDLILESDGYVPPTFQGKIPLSYQNPYRLIAMPHLKDAKGVEYDPKTLVYQWTKDSRLVQDQSGYAKQVFSWKDEMVPRQRTISVKVFTRDGSAQAQKTIFLEATAPFVALYEDDPLYGTLYNRSLHDQVNLGKSGEVSILAVPFGFNKPVDSLGNLSFSWLLNSVKQDTLNNNQSITLRAPEGTKGTSNIQVTVTNSEDFLEKAEKAFSAIFNNSSTANAFNSINSTNSNGL